MKNKNGITLIALVITIILLLILAGVVLNLAIGENGIIKLAEKAGKNYLDASMYEQKELEKLYTEMLNGNLPNYTMLYDGNEINEEKRENVGVTKGWVDVSANCTNGFGTGAKRKITKNQSNINLYLQRSKDYNATTALSINEKIGNMSYYKIYAEMTGRASSNSYTGNSTQICFLKKDPLTNKFSIYGSNDDRIDINKYSFCHSGASYTNKILSTYKPNEKEAYLCIFTSLYDSTLTLNTYSFSTDLQNCWIVNKDNYSALANKANLEGNYDNIEDILNEKAITKICEHEAAIEYMIKECTGDFMCELLANDQAIGYLSPMVKNQMIKDKNWNKFIKIYEKEEMFK